MALCVVTDEGDGVLELKNIAVEPVCQKKGYGRRLIRFICQKYKKSVPYPSGRNGRQPSYSAVLRALRLYYGDL